MRERSLSGVSASGSVWQQIVEVQCEMTHSHTHKAETAQIHDERDGLLRCNQTRFVQRCGLVSYAQLESTVPVQ